MDRREFLYIPLFDIAFRKNKSSGKIFIFFEKSRRRKENLPLFSYFKIVFADNINVIIKMNMTFVCLLLRM